MNEQECTAAYQELVETLNESNLERLVQRVEEVIERGKEVFVKDDQYTSFITTKPYTEREKLFLLIDAIERALVETAAIEVEISNFLIQEKLEPKIITSNGKRDRVDDYRPEVVHAKKQKADILKQLLDELRQDALAYDH